MLRGTIMAPVQPLVLVPACNRMLGEHPFHIAGRKYVDAVRLAGALPLVVPRALPQDVQAHTRCPMPILR